MSENAFFRGERRGERRGETCSLKIETLFFSTSSERPMLTPTVHDYILMILNNLGETDVRKDCLGVYTVTERENESSSDLFGHLAL